jgi:hypothetical protein
MELEQLYTADKHLEGAEMRVLDELNNPLDFYIRLAGMDSTIWQKASREKQKRAFKRVLDRDDDKDEDSDLSDMVAASLDWRGIEQDGKAIEFSKEAIEELYLKAPYIMDQAILFIHNRANFMKS